MFGRTLVASVILAAMLTACGPVHPTETPRPPLPIAASTSAKPWPEPHASLNEKDKVESAAHAAICAGRLTLSQAQQGIATNWVELGQRLGVKY